MLITDKVYLVYENDRGLSLGLAPFTDYFLYSCEERLRNEISNTDIQYLDGRSHNSMKAGERSIVIEGFFNNFRNQEQMARQIERVFSIKTYGKLTYKHEKRKQKVYEIDVMVAGLPKIELINGRTHFSIELVCEKPFWRGTGESVPLAYTEKMFRFPVGAVSPGGKPTPKFIFGVEKSRLVNEFENMGDAPAGVKFLLKASKGMLTNPSITLDGEKTVKVVRHFEKGEYVEIISAPDKVSCRINGVENGMKYLTDMGKSDFFMLGIGRNIISYDADINVMNMTVVASYTPLYTGVF